MKKYTRIRQWAIESSTAAGLCLAVVLGTSDLSAQQFRPRPPGGGQRGPIDPGVRPGAPDAGPTVPGLSADELNAFVLAKEAFDAVDSVSGTIPGEDDEGLGPTFNLNSCAGCHAFPAVGGTSPKINPQIAVATMHGAKNTIPSFLSETGPVREVRFKKNADGTPDGGVHSLFVITGRPDAPAGFNLRQTDFAPHIASGNVVFRIPTPLFGMGLIEAITDRAILENRVANAAVKSQLGISGHPNYNGNDGTVSRFGWKAQNKSLVIFAGEAYNVEQGVTNEVFPNARELGTQGLDDGQPESGIDLATGAIGDVEEFAVFMRLLDAPKRRTPPNITADSIAAGNSRFNSIGCVQCHTASLTSGRAPVVALSNKPVPLFSDLLVHNMGQTLADGVTQGGAGNDEFRTAPLWGLGQRIFFLHDGRTTDLDDAICAHSSNGSEANTVIQNYRNLSQVEKQDVINFLRSL